MFFVFIRILFFVSLSWTYIGFQAWAKEGADKRVQEPVTANPSLVFGEKEGLTAVSFENSESLSVQQESPASAQKSRRATNNPASRSNTQNLNTASSTTTKLKASSSNLNSAGNSNNQNLNTAGQNPTVKALQKKPLEVSTGPSVTSSSVVNPTNAVSPSVVGPSTASSTASSPALGPTATDHNALSPAEAESASTDSISESFAPTKNKKNYEILDSLIDDTSWIFQKKKSRHKLAIVPSYTYNGTQNSLLGLRVFAFSPKKEGYYLAISGAKYIFKPYYSMLFTYKSDRSSIIRTEMKAIYDNHPESYYGLLTKYQGMQAPLNEKTQLHAHRIKINYDMFYQQKTEKHYVGLGASFFSRTQRIPLQENQDYFPSEYFLFARAFAGWDSRDNWKYPTKGAFHQLSFGCKASLVFSEAYCQTQGDFRLYVSFLKNVTPIPLLQKTLLSLRAFYGTSLFNPASYAVKYSLGESSFFQNLTSLRGFKSNRFIGDKMYFAQSEIKVPLWKEYLIGALFFELGEVAQQEEAFTGFVYNYGAGVRIGWPNDTGMKLRIDYGMGKDRQNQRNYDVTISFLQAF